MTTASAISHHQADACSRIVSKTISFKPTLSNYIYLQPGFPPYGHTIQPLRGSQARFREDKRGQRPFERCGVLGVETHPLRGPVRCLLGRRLRGVVVQMG